MKTKRNWLQYYSLFKLGLLFSEILLYSPCGRVDQWLGSCPPIKKMLGSIQPLAVCRGELSVERAHSKGELTLKVFSLKTPEAK